MLPDAAGIYAEQEPAQIYDPTLEAYRDTTGRLYDHALEAWRDVWPTRVKDAKIYMDVTLGWPQPSNAGVTNEVGGFVCQNADGSYTIRAQDDNNKVQGFKGITFEPPQGCSEMHVTVDDYSHNNGNGYITFAVIAGNELQWETIPQSRMVLNTTVRGTGWDQSDSVSLHTDYTVDISQYKSYKYFCIQTAVGSAWGAIGWTEITISNIYFV